MIKINFAKVLVLILFIGGCSKENSVSISSFDPSSGDYNSQVTIKGANFSSSGNLVQIGGKDAAVVSSSPTEIVASVPVGAFTGKITVSSGGKLATSADNFTVTSGAWTKMSSLPGRAVTGAGDLFFSVGSKGYVHSSQRTVNGSLADAELWEYDLSSDSWSKKTELSKNFTGVGGVSFNSADRGYILEYQELWEYNPVNNNWTKKGGLPLALNTDQVLCACYVSSINKVALIDFQGSFFTYDPVGDIWGRDNNLIPFSANMKGGDHLCGGIQSKAYFTNGSDVWEWDSSSNQWTQLPAFPGSTSSDYSFVADNELYIGVGFEDNLWVYKSSIKKWVQKSGMIGASRNLPIYLTINNKGFVGMGISNTTNSFLLSDFNKYNP
ncbi:MAG TPA: IPT/TIG domain-containing protein [Cyclobacteriaceae bacterium]|jgi:hypothetical protein|nr:IPT/TIG domain-containing protein [Cyclobacteriaceae bacterium]